MELGRQAGNGDFGDNIYRHGDAARSLDGARKPEDVTSLECDLVAVSLVAGDAVANAASMSSPSCLASCTTAGCAG